jgi:signal peptidase I
MRHGVLGLAALGSVLAGALAFTLLRRHGALVTVNGDSMWPAFNPGDRVLVRRTGADRLRPGKVVVIEQPGDDGQWPLFTRGPIDSRRWIIKRVAAVPGDPRPDAYLPATPEPVEAHVPAGKLVLLGDNPDWSNDSRQMGYFPAERLLGVVVTRIARGGPEDLPREWSG